MKRQPFILLLICAFLLSGAEKALAQEEDYLYELGAGGGMSVAYGDINKSKPLYNPAWAADLVFRYNHSLRWAFVADISSYGLKGDSQDFENHYPNGQTISFDNRFWHLGLRPEFNFWNYGWSNDFREKKRLVPFLTMGLGVGFTSDGGESAWSMSIPMGAGIKLKLARRLNLQLTCLFTKNFSDEADGVKDPMGIESGALKNTDWVGSLMLGVTFEFGTRCIKCNNKEMSP